MVTADGELHAADVLIYGTGFKADHFLIPMEVIGKDGTELMRRPACLQGGGGVQLPQFLLPVRAQLQHCGG